MDKKTIVIIGSFLNTRTFVEKCLAYVYLAVCQILSLVVNIRQRFVHAWMWDRYSST